MGWTFGRKKKRRTLQQNVSGRFSSGYPIELGHAKQAFFMISFVENPDWLTIFAANFDQTNPEKDLRSLRGYVYTSVGQSIEVVPEASLIERIREVRLDG